MAAWPSLYKAIQKSFAGTSGETLLGIGASLAEEAALHELRVVDARPEGVEFRLYLAQISRQI